MKVYLILLLFGEVGGTWGPIPNDMNWCVNHAAEFVDITNDNYGAGLEPMRYDGRDVPIDQFTMGCVELNDSERPELGSTFDVTRLTQPSTAFGKTPS